MKKKIIKYFGLLMLMIMVIIFFVFNNKKMIPYTRNMFYMDTFIEVKIYGYNNEKEKTNKLLDEVDNVYSTYHNLSDRYHEYPNNIYYINHNNDNKEYIDIDTKLYKLLEYSLDMKKNTNNIFNINLGCQIDLWRQYKDNKNGIPSIDELNNCRTNDIILKDNKILNNHPNIDLGGISKGYTTERVKELLEANNRHHYLINAGGNIIAGAHYNNDKYKIGLESPNDKSIYKVLKINNKAIVTSGGYERYFEYNGIKYNHIIDPNTYYPTNKYKSVTIIAQSSDIADIMSTTLYILDKDKGIELSKKYNFDVIWFNLDDTIDTTDGVKLYE